MDQRAVLLIESAPEFSAKGGLFYVDFATEGLPAIALTPHLLLRSIKAAAATYASWSKSCQASLADRRAVPADEPPN